MSLINKMLQDLDERNASAAERAGLSPQLRALPPARKVAWRAPAFAALGALAGGIAVWLALQPGPAPAPPAAAPMPIAPPAPAPSVAMPAVEVPLPAEPEARPEAAARPAKAAPSIGKGLGLNPSLKVDLGLSQPAVAAEPPTPGRAAAAPAPTGPGRIEKQAHGGSASDAADAEYRKAMAEVRRGATVGGIAGLRHALQLDPRFALARQALLSLLVEQQQWDEAQTACAEGLALDPAQSGWAMLLARLQVEKGETALATATLAQYAAQAERNADYQAFYALLLHKLQRPKESAQRYQAALALRPAEGRWWYGLGLALEADQRAPEARQAFQKARDSGSLPADLAAAVEQKLR